jgi:NitT/TauT family transport system ATP-binding protein
VLLSLDHVDKVFGQNTVALRDMTLEVRQGDFISLLGPSGCGKSTALRLIAGLMQPTRGRVRWVDTDARDTLGVVFQEPTLMPWSTVADNVWLPLRLKGRSRREVMPEIEEALATVGLTGFEDAYPRELSGGMKMRVSIARALVTHPRLILMDEPFAALDEITRQAEQRPSRHAGASWLHVIFVTHSVFESVFLSDRIVVMAARPGRVFQELGRRRALSAHGGFPHLGRLHRPLPRRLRDARRAMHGIAHEG